MEHIDENLESVDLGDLLNSLQEEVNELIMDPETSGYESLAEQDIAYGISFTVGMNTSTDVVMDVGCGIGEFYYYVQRFTNESLFKYYGIDRVDQYLDINKFRSSQDQSVVLMNFDIDQFEEAHHMFSEDSLRNLNVLGNIDSNVDWVTMCNVINDDYNPTQIINKIKFWSKVPEKGAVFTFKLNSTEKIADVASKIILDDVLNKKSIIRTDFYPNWISIYVYNSRV